MFESPGRDDREWMSQFGCPTVEVIVRYMVLFVVVAVALGKGRTQNIAKAGTAV